MVAYQKGLDVISNNVSNMNTVAFRGSTVDFADVFSGSPRDDGSEDGDKGLVGAGVDSSQTVLDTTVGQAQSTGRALDALIQGSGYFVVKDSMGATRYTRDGNFDLDANDNLIIQGQTTKVMGLDASGQLVPINLSSLQTNAAKPTTKVQFTGDLSSNDSTFTIPSMTVVDKLGGSHTLKLVFTLDTGAGQAASTVNWDIEAFEGAQSVGTGQLQFIGQVPSEPVDITLALAGGQSTDVSLDFTGVQDQSIVTSNPTSGTPNSTLAVSTQDGIASGTLSSETFDDKGVMQLTYSNGQTVAGPTLALAEIPDEHGLVELSNSLFDYQGSKPAVLRTAGDDVKIQAQSLEGSNVDLTTEFSALILMQRGYQAASEVVTTANDMLQQLIDIRSGK